jgi:hypothetical protein
MWSLTSPRAKRISGSKNFRPSAKNDFFNTIRQKLPIEQAEFACLPTASSPALAVASLSNAAILRMKQ